MNQLFGIPTNLLAVASALALALVLLVLAWLAWRRPLLVRLGLRAVPRRWLRSALIVAGLTTSTAVVATAIGTGETRVSDAAGIAPSPQGFAVSSYDGRFERNTADVAWDQHIIRLGRL